MTKNYDKIIETAVARAFEAGRRLPRQLQKDAYRDTERRLYALPVLKDKLAEDNIDLNRLMKEQVPDIVTHSRDIVRLRRSGRRLTDEELFQAQITDLQAKTALKEHEISEIEKGLDRIKGDYYYRTVPMKYFHQSSDDETAAEFRCDPSTIRRNRSRLVRTLAVWLYGPEAI